MKLFIKNMVCDRCKMAVENVLAAQQLHPLSMQLGEVEIDDALTKEQTEKLRTALETLGFELMDDKRSRQIEKIKNAIIALVRANAPDRTTNLSDHIAAKLQQDYNYLSRLFSEVEG